MSSVMEPAYVTEARNLIGIREIKGGQHHPEILRLWGDAHMGHITDDETAWCAALVGGTLERSGVKSTRKPNARSYCDWGIDVMPMGVLHYPLGTVVVMSRPPNAWMGHVGYAVGYNRNGLLMVLGGNQSDSVSIAAFDPRRVIAARLPLSMRNTDLKLLPRIRELDVNGSLSTNEA